MPIKEWFRRHQPIQLYVVLAVTIIFFIIELVVSHITHALTLLMNSYQMLCNIVALTGYIVTIKFQYEETQASTEQNKNRSNKTTEEKECQSKEDKLTEASYKLEATEHKLKNTFGWARIDVICMLICCVFLGSLCFSLLVEALQTLVHIDHHHEMHHPISILCLGIAGFCVNIVCYLLIGGYTFHQGSFLYVTNTGDVVLNKVTVNDARQGERRLSRTRTISSDLAKQRQGIREMCRDVLGSILVIISAVWVYFSSRNNAKYIDPGLSLLHAVSLMYLSFPYMKESCFILLQTMPGSINIDSLKIDLFSHFPDIINIHDFHVWQLTANKVISTVHIIFQNPKVYTRIVEDIKDFFSTNGITQVTIQPEFFTKSLVEDVVLSKKSINQCLMKCKGGCVSSQCCPLEEIDDLLEVKHKEPLPGYDSKPNLKAIRMISEDLPPTPRTSSSSNESLDARALLDDINYRQENQLVVESEKVTNKEHKPKITS